MRFVMYAYQPIVFLFHLPIFKFSNFPFRYIFISTDIPSLRTSDIENVNHISNPIRMYISI